MEYVSIPATEALPPLDSWYPWPPGRPWLRCMMVMSLDGAFRGADGRSRALSSAADQRVLLQTRRWAHGVVIGAETMRRERYQRLSCGNETVRQESGLAPQPTLVIVSASLELPWHDEAFAAKAPRPIVVTTREASASARRVASRYAEVIALPGPCIDVRQLLDELHGRGMFHLVSEGGPHLEAHLIRADVVDEMDVTIAPLTAGGGQIVTGDAMSSPHCLRLESVIEHDGWLFTRYTRQPSSRK